jgi:hypothetical protein
MRRFTDERSPMREAASVLAFFRTCGAMTSQTIESYYARGSCDSASTSRRNDGSAKPVVFRGANAPNTSDPITKARTAPLSRSVNLPLERRQIA